MPFAKPHDLGPETAACLAVIAERVRAATGAPLGIDVLANAPPHAFAVAAASGAAFIRVNQRANAYVADEGFMEGRTGEAMRCRSLLRAGGGTPWRPGGSRRWSGRPSPRSEPSP